MNLLLPAVEALGAGAAAFGALAWVCASPTNQFWGTVHARANVASPGVYALSFDDGPTRESTTAILDTLAELGVRATFFVIGVNARRCPDLLVRMDAEGHLVANHSLDHTHWSMFRGNRYWDRQLREADRIIQGAIGKRPALFRPPMGVKTCFVMGAARRNGHAVIAWSRRGIDGVTTTAPRILERLVPRTQGGDVVALHDGIEPHSRRSPAATIAALKPLILQLRKRGLRPAPLHELLNLPAYAPHSAAATS